MAILTSVTTNVPIDSNGNCPDPSGIVSEVHRGGTIKYVLVPADPNQKIGDWRFVAFVTRKPDNGILPLGISVQLQEENVVILPTMPLGTTDVNLKIFNFVTKAQSVIDPKIIVIP